MKHDFEEFFPLPWGIKHRQQCYDMGYTEDFFMLDLNSKGQGDDVPPSLVDFTARGGYDHLKGRDDIEEARKAVLAYIVTCANLMPEAVTLFGIVEEVLTLCATRAFDTETKHLLSHTAETVQTFKKKLEGGNDNEPR